MSAFPTVPAWCPRCHAEFQVVPAIRRFVLDSGTVYIEFAGVEFRHNCPEVHR